MNTLLAVLLAATAAGTTTWMDDFTTEHWKGTKLIETTKDYTAAINALAEKVEALEYLVYFQIANKTERTMTIVDETQVRFPFLPRVVPRIKTDGQTVNINGADHWTSDCVHYFPVP